MTSPLGSSSLTISPPPQEEALTAGIKETTKLIEKLLRFSLGGTSSSVTESDELLATSSIQTVSLLSDQLNSIQNETAKSCEEIARSIIKNKLSLGACLTENRVLSLSEMIAVKSLLTRTPTPPAIPPRKRPAPEDPSSSEEKLLPIKKRPSYRTSITQQTSTKICSLNTLSLLLQLLSIDKKYHKKFQCLEHAPASSCDKCTVIKNTLQKIANNKSNALMLARQITTLLNFTSLKKLADAIFKHEGILNLVANGCCLPNHVLAVICLECDIGDGICAENADNPKHQAVLYSYMYNLTSQGLKSPFVSQIKKLWETVTLKSQSTVQNIKVAQTPDGSRCQLLSQIDFSNSIPKVQRAYPFFHKQQNRTYHSHRKITRGLVVYLTQAVFKTVQAIIETPQFHHLLVTTPEGEKVPSHSLLIELLALILCSNNDWSIRILPCKASVAHKQFCTFDRALTESMHAALSSFNVRNVICLQGRRLF